MAKQPTYNDQFRSGVKALARAGIEQASREAQLLLRAACGQEGDTWLMLCGDEAMPPAQIKMYKQFLVRRAFQEPVAYITGKKYFWTISCFVNEHVLIPRPETEGVVERGLALLEGVKMPRILDIGTGSGAILISLLREQPAAHGVGVDISDEALKIAARNAQENVVDERCIWQKSDFLSAVEGQFDLVVSNPPYIDECAMEVLPDDVKIFEPHLALSGGADGLTAYREIIKDLPRVLKPSGHVVFEIGFDQGKTVPELLAAAGMTDIKLHKDLSGHDRIVSAKMCEN